MTSKHKTMADLIRVKEQQDGMGLIKLIRNAIFEQGSSNQSIMEFVAAMKKILVFQKKDKTVNKYTHNFKVFLDIPD